MPGIGSIIGAGNWGNTSGEVICNDIISLSIKSILFLYLDLVWALITADVFIIRGLVYNILGCYSLIQYNISVSLAYDTAPLVIVTTHGLILLFVADIIGLVNIIYGTIVSAVPITLNDNIWGQVYWLLGKFLLYFKCK